MAWLLVAGALTAAALLRIQRRKPDVDWSGRGQLRWLLLAWLLTAVITGGMLIGASEGRLPIPGRGFGEFYLQQQPMAFWLLLSVEFLLTVVLGSILTAVLILVFRSSRRGA